MQAFLAALNQSNLENLQGIVQVMRDQHSESLVKLQSTLAQVISHSADKPKTTNMVDSRGIGKPGVFKGDESKFIEWIAKLNAFLRSSNPNGMTWARST